MRAARGRADLTCPAGLGGPGVRVSEDGSAARSVTPSASKSGSGQRRHWHEPSRRSRLVVVVARARGGLCPSGACGRWGRLRTPPQCTAAGLAPLAGFRGPGAGGLHNRVKWLGSRGRGIVDGDRHRVGRGDRQRGRLVLPVARRRRSWWHLNWWHLHRVWKGRLCIWSRRIVRILDDNDNRIVDADLIVLLHQFWALHIGLASASIKCTDQQRKKAK